MSAPSPPSSGSSSRQPWLTRALGLPNGDGARSLLARELSGCRVTPAQLAAMLAPFRIGAGDIAKLAEAAIARRATTLSLDDFRAGLADRLEACAAALAPGRTSAAGALHGRAGELLTGACRQVPERGSRTDADDEELLADAAALGLAASDVSSKLSAAVFDVASRRLAALSADGELSPADDAELATMFAGFKVLDDWPPSIAARMAELREIWRVRHAALAPIASPVGLKRGEVALAKATAEAHEIHTRMERVGFAGPSLRIRIVKGVYYRAGAYDVGGQTGDVDETLGVGDLVVTSKRLVFASEQRSISFAIDSILKVEWPSANAVRVIRSSGKPLTFVLRSADAHFAELLERARGGEVSGALAGADGG